MSNVVLVKHRNNWGLEEEKVVTTAKGILKEFGIDGAELSLVFVGRKEAKSLNIKYRKMDYVPQVLAFPMDKEGMLGDIVICTQKLKREKASLEEWIRHGVQNLLK